MTSTAKDITIQLFDNTAIKGRSENYKTVMVNTKKVLKSWRDSLFAYEWMTSDGDLKSKEALPEKERTKRENVEKNIHAQEPLERPVLGIGMMDNIEIGAGKAVFLTLASQGHKQIQVHVPKSQIDEFEKFIV